MNVEKVRKIKKMQAQKFEKFIKLMMMTTSPNDGEVLNAVRMANAALIEANLNWDEFLRGKARITGDTPTVHSGKKYDNASEINQMFDAVLQNVKPGSSFFKFLESIHDWWDVKGWLTEKQYNALRKTYERI